MFIYGLVDPRSGCLRYVGQTKNLKERFWGHTGMASVSRHRCAAWIRGLRKLGLKPVLEVLEEVSTEQANDAERFWIASLRAAGASLLNMTDGGDGSPGVARPDVTVRFKGIPKSEATKERMRAAKTADLRASVASFHAGRARPAETKARMSEWQKGKPRTPAQQASLAKAQAARRGAL